MKKHVKRKSAREWIAHHRRMIAAGELINQPGVVNHHKERLRYWLKVQELQRPLILARLKRDLIRSNEMIDAEMREVCL
jgi:hypothetical protein